jgi:hypothetical protein
MENFVILQRKRLTKKLINKMSTITNSLFKESALEAFGHDTALEFGGIDFLMSEVRYMSLINGLSYSNMPYIRQMLEKKTICDEIYLTKITCLSTQELSDILFLHERKKPIRAQRTIDCINIELARRILLNDTNKSDININNGDY